MGSRSFHTIYDALNRVTKVEEQPFSSSGVQPLSFSQRFLYDRSGNRTIDQATWGANINKALYTVDAATNRFTQLGYDAAGNVTTDGGQARTYDAENRMKTAGSHVYTYDASGRRVRRAIFTGSVWQTYWQVYGMSGELVAEYLAETQPAAPYGEYGYRNGQMLVTSNCADGLRWMMTDHLGSTRVEVSLQGGVAKRHDYLPFGEELYAGSGDYDLRGQTGGYPGTDCIRQKFTGKERDIETGLDFFEARYFASVQGRFTSVDPLLSSGAVQAPQTWNRYTYTLNNPLRYTDPLGLFTWDDSAGGSASDAELEARRNNRRLSRSERDQARVALERRTRFRNAMARARQAASSNSLTAGEQTEINSALNAYGAEGVDNGVTVGGGTLTNNRGGAEATPNFTYDEATNSWRTSVSVIVDDNARGDNIALKVAHEGQHVADAQAFGAALTRLGNAALTDVSNRTRYDREFRAYSVESLGAQGLGQANWHVGSRQTLIWDNGWAAADRARLRTAGINDHLANSPTYRVSGQGLTPQNPGPRYINQ